MADRPSSRRAPSRSGFDALEGGRPLDTALTRHEYWVPFVGEVSVQVVAVISEVLRFVQVPPVER